MLRVTFLAAVAIDLFVTLVGEFGMPHASEVAARAAHEISDGRYRTHFWLGSVALGHVAAFVLALPHWPPPGRGGALRDCGALLLRVCVRDGAAGDSQQLKTRLSRAEYRVGGTTMRVKRRKRTLLLTGLLLLSALPLLAANGAPSTPTAPPAPVAIVDEPAAVAPLLDLLSFVPDTPENRSMVTFGDVDAWYAATGNARIGSLDEIDTLSDAQREAMLFILPTQTLPPDALGLQYLRTGDLRERLGFNYFDAAQMLQAGQPPDLITALNVNADPAAIGAVLGTAGYTATEASGATLYSLRDDYEIDMQDSSPVGRLGALNRVAVIDERADPATVLIARATGVANGRARRPRRRDPVAGRRSALRPGHRVPDQRHLRLSGAAGGADPAAADAGRPDGGAGSGGRGLAAAGGTVPERADAAHAAQRLRHLPRRREHGAACSL